MHNELLHWHPGALFFPEAEGTLVEGGLPDPETAAERLALYVTDEEEDGINGIEEIAEKTAQLHLTPSLVNLKISKIPSIPSTPPIHAPRISPPLFSPTGSVGLRPAISWSMK